MEATSIVLAGGRSRRLGYDKLLEKVGTRCLLEKVLDSVAPLSSDIIIVTAEERAIPPFADYPNLKVVTDLYPGKGPLVGVYTGLRVSATHRNIVVAADMPFLSPALLRYMVGLADGFDVVAPRVEDKVEPLHCVYTRRCLAAIERMLEQGELGVHRLLPLVKVRYVEMDEIIRFDPERLSFFNINTEKDLQVARELSGGGEGNDKR